MVLPVAFIIGAIFGVSKAKRRNGNTFDKLHYGATHGIAFMLLTLILTIVLQHLGLLI